jgi:flagellar biosynthesis/type III secretory pathway protein FliH
MKKATSIPSSQAIRPEQSRAQGARQGAPRHQAPSRIDYASAHPGRTVRLQPGPDAKVAAICERLDVSFNGGVNIAIDGLDDAELEAIHAHGHQQGYREGFQAGRDQGRADGYAEAKGVYCLTFRCPSCGKPVELRVGDVLARFVLQTLRASDLGHQDGCPEVSN